MTKPKLKKVQADLRKAAEILGKEDITMREYRPIARKYNLTMPYKISVEFGWNRMKTFVFDGEYKPRRNSWSLEEKLDALRRAMNIYGTKMSYSQYKLFAKGKDVPGPTTIIKTHNWDNIKNLALNNTTMEKVKLQEKKSEFCDLCAYKNSCTIEIEECKYWKELDDEMY